MTDDFSDYPVSIAEAKASKHPNGADNWTPRDTLIAALRAIDSGELAPTSLIVVCAIEQENGSLPTIMHYFNCFPRTFYGIGMLQAGIADLLNDG